MLNKNEQELLIKGRVLRLVNEGVTFFPKTVAQSLSREGYQINYSLLRLTVRTMWHSGEMKNYSIKSFEEGGVWDHCYYPQVGWWEMFKNFFKK